MLFNRRPKSGNLVLGIDGGSFVPGSQVTNGIERLVSSFYTHVENRLGPGDKSYYYYFTKKGIVHLNENKIQKHRLPDRFFSSVFLPLRMSLDKVNVYLGFSGVLPPLVRLQGIKSIIFLHDFGFYHKSDLYAQPEKMRWQTEYVLHGADKIVVFSDHIKDDLEKRFPKIPKNRIIRIYPGFDHLHTKQRKNTPVRRNFLYVGVIKPMKHIELLLYYFSEYKKLTGSSDKLIFVGVAEEEYLAKLKQIATYQIMKEHILIKKRLSDHELIAEYKQAKALLNVSFEEGFCYPVVEALTLGTPVIVNDIPVYREFQRYFPHIYITRDKDAFINRMKTALQHNDISYKPSPFTWDSFAFQVTDIAKTLI